MNKGEDFCSLLDEEKLRNGRTGGRTAVGGGQKNTGKAFLSDAIRYQKT